MTDNDPSISRIKRVPVGTIVKYHGRIGSMRQGRTEFGALVLHQHPDDGTLDLLVWFEAEDQIWEQRVSPWSPTNPGHSWEHVEQPEADGIAELKAVVESAVEGISLLNENVGRLQAQMYGEYNAPPRALIEYLDEFAEQLGDIRKRLTKLETKHRTG